MDALDLLDKCRRAQEQQKRPDADVFLTIRGKWGRRTHARLFGRNGGPQGRIVGDQIPSAPPRCIAVFKADAIMVALDGKDRRV